MKNLQITTIAKNFVLLVTISLFIAGCGKNFKPSTEFGAYYTKINSGEEFEQYSRTGPYADIIIDFGKENGKVIFWRGTSYLPYFETTSGNKVMFDEVIPRSGDGTETMPDRTNTYSIVKIVENTPEKIVINWRYLPEFGAGNPHTGVDAAKFCEENFTFMPDGSVTRTIREGEEKIDDWKDITNQITQTLKITTTGFAKTEETPAKRSFVPEAIQGNPVVAENVAEPAVWFKFDEAKGDVVVESKSGTELVIPGNKTQWRKGASGTAVQFDGHKNYVSFPAEKAPAINDAITLEGWAAMAAYPWSWTTIVQQMDDVPEKRRFFRYGKEITSGKGNNEDEEWEESEEPLDFPWDDRFTVKYEKEDDTGYFLGINGLGKAGFKLRVGGVWEELFSDRTLKKDVLYHIAATFDKDSGKMLLYIDGKLDCEKQVAKAVIETSDKDILVAKGKDRAQIAPVRKNTFPAPYTFDGILDEVKIYTSALTADQIAESYNNYGIEEESMADMEERKFPVGERTGNFGARYTFLEFYDSWENLWRTGDYGDVIVEFENNPSKFIFWRGMSFIEMMGNEKDQFYSNEFNETWNRSGGEGCMEPMSDKGSYYDHAKIIENTPARTVVEWRFALKDVNYVMANYQPETGWCDWASWYYYIYPDGIAAKVQQLWSTPELFPREIERGRDGYDHEWQESMTIFGPNQHPHDVISRENTLTYIDLEGDPMVFQWEKGPPSREDVQPAVGRNIQVINFTGEYDPVTIVQENTSLGIYGGELTDYAVFCTWNHWPVAQQPSDGRYALFPDRTGHSSLTHIGYDYYEEVLEKDSKTPYKKKMMMQGMLNKEPAELAVLANSWINPPKLVNAKGCSGEYDKSQRAYVVKATETPLSFTIAGSEVNPVYNLGLVIKSWGDKAEAKVNVDGERTNVKQGVIRDVDGSYTLNVFIEKQASGPVNIEISK